MCRATSCATARSSPAPRCCAAGLTASTTCISSRTQRSKREHGVRPIERLRRLGLLGPNLIAVHSVHVSTEEIQLLSRHGCSVVHCPSSNLKLASGFAPVAALLKAQINVALGTDGAASNNRLDLFQEMRTAALLAQAVARDAEA